MKSLLVALDGSSRAKAVLKAAVDQAQATGAKLVLLRAVGIPVELPYAAMAMSPADVVSVLEQRANADLTELARELVPSAVPWEMRVETGVAWQCICHAAQTVDAALIVIGSHGYGALDRMLGTTAARVVNHADRSVLVVRSPDVRRAPSVDAKAK
jgi:nucleotide-binding universal stress UspA family protein